MSYLLIAIFAYFINAAVSVTDKFLVSKKIPDSIAYAFYIGILSIFACLFIPFIKFSVPPIKILLIALASGAIFLFALLLFFSVLFKEEVSRISAIVFGGLMPIFVLIFSALIIGEKLSINQIIAFVFLVAGSALIYRPDKTAGGGQNKHFIKLFLTAAFFALSYVLAKWVYIYQPFMNGFIWTRIGSFLAALFLFIFPKNRQAIFKTGKSVKARSGFLLAGNKALAGLYFVLFNWAISMGSVTMVNALQGIQYVFIFLITLLLSSKFPDIIKEDLDKREIWKKFLAIILIGIGLVVLSL